MGGGLFFCIVKNSRYEESVATCMFNYFVALLVGGVFLLSKEILFFSPRIMAIVCAWQFVATS